MSEFLSKYAVCPYYKDIQGKCLACESIIGKYDIHHFENREKMKAYFKKYCCSYDEYHNCKYAENVEKKYF